MLEGERMRKQSSGNAKVGGGGGVPRQHISKGTAAHGGVHAGAQEKNWNEPQRETTTS